MSTLSVLIAAFNAQRWLRPCLRSVYRQRLPAGWRLEVILGIDACLSTLRLAQGLRENDTRIVFLTSNCGPYVTFNTLMPFATGALICRFDADDVMLPGYLSRQVALLTGPDVTDLSMTWSIATDHRLFPLRHKGDPRSSDDYAKGLEGQIVFRRRVWDALGAFRPWRCAADTDFVHRARVSGLNIGVVEAYLYYRRTHQDSLTANTATGFGSALRQTYTRQGQDYRLVYAKSPDSIKLAPVVAPIGAVIG